MSSGGSFKRVDYSLRPAKHAERRMLCDIFRRLRPFGRIEDYVYVGFGSVWFSDFSLFHRALGIKEMISIERASTARQRIEDNKPFRIHVDFRDSSAALVDLDWQKKQLLWIDYDDPITTSKLADVSAVASRAQSGTLLALSVQCSRAPQMAEFDQDKSPAAPSALERFVNTFGRERVPAGTTEEQLYGWGFGSLSRQMILDEIQAALAVRKSGGQSIDFHPICNIEYEDGAKMTTLVGIFYSSQDAQLLQECRFEALDFVAVGSDTVRISVPKLTIREFRKLESQLPLNDGETLDLGSIPQSEANNFAEMYRYLPNFAVLEG